MTTLLSESPIGGALVDALAAALQPFKDVHYACIFGSVARGTAHKQSDVDILVIENDGGRRWEVMIAIAQADAKFGVETHPHFFLASEWRQQLRQSASFQINVVSRPRILLKGEKGALTK